MRCSAPGCSNKLVSVNHPDPGGRTFHVWTKNHEQRLVWMEIFRMKYVPYGGAVICSDHFDPEDFTRYALKTSKKLQKRILPNAVPKFKLGQNREDNVKYFHVDEPIVSVSEALKPATWGTVEYLEIEPFSDMDVKIEPSVEETILDPTDKVTEHIWLDEPDYDVDNLAPTCVLSAMLKTGPNVCLICSYKSEDHEPLFEGDTLNSIGIQLNELLELDVRPKAGMPDKICRVCFERIEEFAEFKRTAHAMHRNFLNCIARKSSTNNAKGIKRITIDHLDESDRDFWNRPEYIIDDGGNRLQVITPKNTIGRNGSKPKIRAIQKSTVSDLERRDQEFWNKPEYFTDEEGNAFQIITPPNSIVPNGSETKIRAIRKTIVSDLEDRDREFWNNPEYITDEEGNTIQVITPQNSIGPKGSETKIKAIRKIKKRDENPVPSKIKMRCPICDKEIYKFLLRAHISRHSDERPMQCQMCPKRYKNQLDLNIHLKTHSNERRYVCEICGSAFRNSSAYRDHVRKHSNEFKYKCGHCPDTFKTRSRWMSHHYTKHERRFKCGICDKSFGLKFRVIRHLKIHEKQGTDIKEALQAIRSIALPQWNKLKSVDDNEISKILNDLV